jgi:hypothetical protein
MSSVSVVEILGNQNVGASRSIINNNFQELSNAVNSIFNVIDTSSPAIVFKNLSEIIFGTNAISASVYINANTGITFSTNKSITFGNSGIINMNGTNSSIKVGNASNYVEIKYTAPAGPNVVNIEGNFKIQIKDHIVEKSVSYISTENEEITINTYSTIWATENFKFPAASNNFEGKSYLVHNAAGTSINLTLNETSPITINLTPGKTIIIKCVSNGGSAYKWIYTS